MTADTTGSVGLASSLPAGAPGDGEPRRELEAAGALYRANPGNPDAAVRYAAALRAIGNWIKERRVLRLVLRHLVQDSRRRAGFFPNLMPWRS
jgi:hypothetical protein